VIVISFREKPAMNKLKTTGLAGRKGVRLGPKGGSISEEVIQAWIYRPMPESGQNFIPFS